MKRQRFALGFVIGLAAGISAIYAMSVMFQPSALVVFGLFVLALAATTWMIIRILKDPYSTDKTFEEQFYQDRDDIRRNRMR